MVKQWQKLYYKGRMAFSDKSLRSKDFVKTAEADGFKFAMRLDQNDNLERVVREWLEFPGPAFLEVIIDPDANVYPMVGPGLAYDQMVTGDFIPTRKKVSEEDIDGSEMF
jgi:acetolactate synthase-1/2/3 large subunit